MSKRITIGCCLALLLLVIALIGWMAFSPRPQYGAEALLAVRPLNNALLRRAFERQVLRSNPGVVRLGFQSSIYTETTLKGTTRQTNGVIRVIAAAPTAAEAERIANQVADRVRLAIRRVYGADTRILVPAHSIPAAGIYESFGLRLRSPGQSAFPTAGRVFFPEAGLSLDLGAEWKRYYSICAGTDCNTSLAGDKRYSGAFVRAWLLGPTITNLDSGVHELRPQIDREVGLVASSRKEQPFVSEGGLHGTQVSFLKRYPIASATPGATTLISHSIHYYVVTNAHARCVILMLSTVLSPSESDQIRRMIQSTLRAD